MRRSISGKLIFTTNPTTTLFDIFFYCEEKVRKVVDERHRQGWSRFNETMEETFDRVLSLKTDDYEQLVRKQQKVAARYTYRESLESIVQALQEIKK